MKFKRKNRSVLFRGMVLGLAMAFTVLCFPANQVIASAEQMDNFTDYTYMTIGTKKEEVVTTVNKGATYVVPKAYIGGDKNRAVGANITDKDLSSDVKLLSSKVTVKYSSEIVGEVVDGVASSTGSVTVSDGGNAQFDANKVGSYTVTYSYTYTVKGVEYTNSYDMTVTSEITDADINFGDNEKVFLPSILDLAQAQKSDGSFKDMYIPMPEILDDEGEEVDTSDEDFEFITSRTNIGNKKKQVLIQVSASTNSTNVAVSKDEESGLYYVAGSVFADEQYGAGKYTVTYSYYEGGQFVASTTKTTQVYAKNDAYYKDYALRLQLNSDFVDNGQTGVETTLPTAKGVTSTSTTPKSEAVDIYYTVTVYYRTSTGSYKLIDADKYNASVGEDEDKIVNEDGTLVDPTKFKPLDDGYYSFVYEGYDYYYDAAAGKDARANRNHYFRTDLGLYEYKNIKDEKAPTPVVYEATKEGTLDNVDASAKMATRANAESVVIYAIGIDDNVSKAKDEGVVLTRRIMTDETVSKITLSSTDERDLSDFNLIFNYAGKFDASATEKKFGRDGLKTNNYLIRNQMEKENVADTEEATLAWLKENKYLIVVDNANYERLYENFKDSNVFDETVTDKDSAFKWFKSNAAFEKGFAYINCDQTFGSSAAITGGMGVGQYYIHYIAKDAAGNETDIYKRLYVRDFEDRESPDITFSTSLKDSYLPETKITFNAPTASDNIDENMVVSVMYRYLDDKGAVIEVVNKKDEVVSNKNLNDLWTALGTDPDGEGVRDDNNTLLTTKYAKYHEGENDGYVDITDAKANSFTIDLGEVEGAAKLQIIAYTYDDAGNPMLYGQTIDINNIQDEFPPQLLSVNSIEDVFSNKYEQGAVVALPKITVADDAVGYMTSEVKVDYIENGERYSRSVRETSVDRENNGAAGKFVVNAGEFVAAKDGKYQASIAVKDANNKTIVVFANYEVSPRATVQKPTISSTLTSQEIELDDKETIEIPAPTVNFEFGDSVTEDVFKENGNTATETYVIRGLNADGKATNWSTNNEDATNGIFTPSKKGQFEIKYSVKLEAYNHNEFTFVEMSGPTYDDDKDEVVYKDGGYYTNKTLGDAVQITVGATGEHRLKVGSDFYVVKNDNGNITFYASNENYSSLEEIAQNEFSNAQLKTLDFDQWFKDLRVYNLESEIYTITVNDTKGPKLVNYDYSDQEFMSVEDFRANGITIYGIQTAADVSGIDSSKSEIRLSWKRANGTAAGDTGSTTYQNADALKDNVFKSSASNLNGRYTITYEVYDNNGNRSTATYTINVGDNEAPTIKLPDNFVKTTYTLKDKLVIDTKDITISDNNPMPADAKPVIKLVNTSKNNEEVKYTVEGTKYIFDSFEEYGEGSYKLTIEVEDAVGHVTTEEINFSVATKSKTSTETYKVVGTVLIVISVLVLAGVIVYFIVSKVKLDKELKK